AMHSSGVSNRSTSLRGRRRVPPAPRARARAASGKAPLGEVSRSFMRELLVLEAKLREHGAERGESLLDPQHGMSERLGVAQGIRGKLPIVLAELHFRESLVDDAFLANGLTHGISFRVTDAELGRNALAAPGICVDPITFHALPAALEAPCTKAPSRRRSVGLV